MALMAPVAQKGELRRALFSEAAPEWTPPDTQGSRKAKPLWLWGRRRKEMGRGGEEKKKQGGNIWSSARSFGGGGGNGCLRNYISSTVSQQQRRLAKSVLAGASNG